MKWWVGRIVLCDEWTKFYRNWTGIILLPILRKKILRNPQLESVEIIQPSEDDELLVSLSGSCSIIYQSSSRLQRMTQRSVSCCPVPSRGATNKPQDSGHSLLLLLSHWRSNLNNNNSQVGLDMCWLRAVWIFNTTVTVLVFSQSESDWWSVHSQ